MSPPRTGAPRALAAPLILTLLLLPSLPGCASTGNARSSASSDEITMEELRDWSGRSLDEAIQALRPRWLRARGGRSIQFGEEVVKVVLDGAIIGSAPELGQIPVDTVREVRFLDAAEATTRYGTGFGAGAIDVRTRGD